MAKKANIQKIREDMLLDGGSKRTILPVTVAKAVQVEKQDKTYEGLDRALVRKWERCITYTVSTDEGDINGRAHYLFAFNSAANRVAFKRLMFTTAGTPNTNEEFAEFLTSTYGPLDEEDSDILYEVLDIPAFTESNLLTRIRISHVANTFVDYTRLHDSPGSGLNVIDENGIPYVPGSTITFTKYPGILYVKTNNLSHDYQESLAQALRVTEGAERIRYDWIFNSPVEALDNVQLKVKVTEPAQVTGAQMKPFELRDYAIPLNYYSDYLRNLDDWEYNIDVINATIKLYYNNYIKVFIYPSDHPVLAGVVDEQVIYDYESSGVKKGTLTIEDCLSLDGVKFDINDALGLNKYKIIFNVETTPPQSDPVDPDDPVTPDPDPQPDEPKFAFESPDRGANVVLNNTNKWINKILVKGVNVRSIGKTYVYIEEPTDFELYIPTSSASVGSNRVELTSAQVINGVEVYVRPKNWKNEKNYCPYEEAGIHNDIIRCSYSATENEQILDSAETYVNLNCVVQESEITPVTPTIEPTIKPFDGTNRLIEMELKMTNVTAGSGYFDVPGIDGFYYNVTLNPNGNIVTKKYFESTNNVTYSTVKEGDEYIDYQPFSFSRTFTAEELLSGVSFRVQIPMKDFEGNVIKGDGKVIVYTCWNSNHSGVENVSKDVECEFTVNYESVPAGYSDFVEKYRALNGSNTVLVAESPSDTRWVDLVYGGATHNPKQTEDSEVTPSTPNSHKADNIPTNHSSNVVNQGWADGVTGLRPNAFDGAPLTKGQVEFTLEMLQNVDTIPDYAFANNTEIEELDIPDNIKYIGYRAFYNCTNLTRIKFPNSVVSLERAVCENCTNLEVVDFGENVLEIPNRGFDGCPNITDIYIRRPYSSYDDMSEVTHSRSYFGIRNTYSFDHALDDNSNLTLHILCDGDITFQDFATRFAGGELYVLFFGNHFEQATLRDINNE